MKVKKVWIGAIAFVFFFSACKQLDKLTQFYVNYESNIAYNSGLPVSLPISIATPDMPTNAEEEFANNDTRKDLIESIKLKLLKLTITNPSGKTFSFLKDIRVYISAPGLPEVEVANKLNIDDNVSSTLDLAVFDVELQEYIKADKFSLRTFSTTDQVLTGSVQVKVESRFFVDAKILGI